MGENPTSWSRGREYKALAAAYNVGFTNTTELEDTDEVLVLTKEPVQEALANNSYEAFLHSFETQGYTLLDFETWAEKEGL
ncbi:hypothetical protein D3C81_1069350 [compost metagenome]